MAMQYLSKIRGYQGENPAKLVLEDAWEWGGAKGKKESFIFKMNKEMEKLELGVMGMARIVHWPTVPPWLLPTPDLSLSLLEALKAQDSISHSEVVVRRLESA